MSTKTISEIRAVTGIAERTIRYAATDGPLSAVSRQSGRTWLIDDESEVYKEWLCKHWKQPRVKGSTRSSNG